MAGTRPQRRIALTGIHIWLIVFVALWLASTVFAVLMFTNQEQLRQNTAQAETKLRAVALPNELSQPAIAAMQQQATSSQPPRTLVKVMQENQKALAARLTGHAEDDLKAAETQWSGVVEEIATGGKVPDADQIGRNTGAIPALKQMYEWYAAEHDAAQKSGQSVQDLTKSLEEAQARNKKLEEDFSTKQKANERTAANVSKDKEQVTVVKTKEVEDLGKNLASKQEQIGALNKSMAQQANAHAAEIKQIDKTLTDQATLLSQYRSPGPEGTNELDEARQPIGRILRALPGDSLVHIDLGKLDGVKLGMSFSVYDFDKKVPVDGRGKATIEAVNVGPHTTECRVVTPPPPDAPILEEDRVGNILISRQRARRSRFVVIGGFDTDYDGQVDPLGYDKVVAYIERFGGEIVDNVDATTDYIVVGRRPEFTTAGTSTTQRDPTAVTKQRRTARDAAHYDAVLQKALLVAAPRLRQDQFFNFIGLELGRDLGQRLMP